MINYKTNNGFIPRLVLQKNTEGRVSHWMVQEVNSDAEATIAKAGQAKCGESGGDGGDGVELIENTGAGRHSCSADVMLFM